MSELITVLRRETGNQFRLLCVLSVGLLIPVTLVALALTMQNAAANLEDRRHISAFATDSNEAVVATLKQSLINNPQIERVTILPADENIPAILEIKPALALTENQTDLLARTLENSGAFTFVSVNRQLLKRNAGSHNKAKKLALVLFLFALVAAALTCMITIKREILRSNSANINLQRQLGATPTTISRPYIVRAALITMLATIGAAAMVTVFYKTLEHYADISTYSTVLLDSLPVAHLIVLAIVSVAAACFAAATALQSIFNVLNHILRKIRPGSMLSSQHFLIEN